MLSQLSQSESEERERPSKRTDGLASAPTQEELPKFAWGQRWLKGPEYFLMLEKMDRYCEKFGLAKCKLNQHPLQIYQLPENGMIYFMEGKSLEAFGFPRIQKRKVYRWKKMNFTTNLPKQKPVVTYLVASSLKRDSLTGESNDEFRMHVVIPYNSQGNHILCHIKKVLPQLKDTWSFQSKSQNLFACFPTHTVDFYRLFAYIHNYHWIQK